MEAHHSPSDGVCVSLSPSDGVCVSLHRFLLCNQATLPPAPRVPYRQLSTQQSVDTAGRREETTGEGGEPMVAEATGERPKKAVSSEDEVARLTIEV